MQRVHAEFSKAGDPDGQQAAVDSRLVSSIGESFGRVEENAEQRRLSFPLPGNGHLSPSTASVSFISSALCLTARRRGPGSLSHGGGSFEVGEEFEAEAHHEVPDVPGHLGSGDEDAPNEHHQDGVEGVADVPQSGEKNKNHTASDHRPFHPERD